MFKRGISPIIATILLVGFVIVLAALIMAWLGNLIDIKTEDIDDLTYIDIEITGVKYLNNNIQVQIENKEQEINIEQLIIRTTDKENLITDEITTTPPVLPSLYTRWFDTTWTDCKEDLEIEAIPKIIKDEKLTTLTASSDKYTAKIDCNGALPQDCSIHQVYWANDPFNVVIVAEGNKVTISVESNGCDNAAIEILKCEDSSCLSYSNTNSLGEYNLFDGITEIVWTTEDVDSTTYYKFKVTSENKESISVNKLRVEDGGVFGSNCLSSSYWSEVNGLKDPYQDVGVSPEELVLINIELDLGAQNYCEEGDPIDIIVYECLNEACTIIIKEKEVQHILNNVPLQEIMISAPENELKQYIFRAEFPSEEMYSSNYLFTSPPGFLGLCSFTLTETQNLIRAKEPVILQYSDIQASCPDIQYATLNSITINEDQALIPIQVDDLDNSNKFDSNDEIIFMAEGFPASQTKTYTIEYNFVEEPIRDYGFPKVINELEQQYGRFGDDAPRYTGISFGYQKTGQPCGFIGTQGGGLGIIFSSARGYCEQPEHPLDYNYIDFDATDVSIEKNGIIRAKISSNINTAEKIGKLDYYIYNNADVFFTETIKWLTDCQNNLQLDSCFYLQMSEFNPSQEIMSGQYGNELSAEAYWPLNPKLISTENIASEEIDWLWMSTQVDIDKSHVQKWTQKVTMALFDFNPGFDLRIVSRRYPTKEDQHRFSIQDNQLVTTGIERTYSSWLTYNADLPPAREENLRYANPLQITIQPNP